MIKMIKVFFIYIFSLTSLADLVALPDEQLGEVDGEGIGVVLEDFVYNAGERVNGGTFEIGGLTGRVNGGNAQEVTLGISQFYIAGSGSNNGVNVLNNPVNLGRLLYPFNIELRNGDDADVGVNDRAVFEFSAPEKTSDLSYFLTATENRRERRSTGAPIASGQRVDRITGTNSSMLSSRSGAERPDIGIRFDLDIGNSRFQSLENHIESLSIDGSRVRLWGGDGHMEGEIVLNLYTPSIEFFACDSNGLNCGQTIDFRNVAIEAELGAGSAQPVTFEVSPSGHFEFSIGSIKNQCSIFNSSGGCSDSAGRAFFNDYYANGPTTNVYLGEVVVAGRSFGSTTVSNLQIQYLEVTSHDL